MRRLMNGVLGRIAAETSGDPAVGTPQLRGGSQWPRTYERLKKIVVEQLGVDEDEVKPEASFVDDLNADSLDLVELIMSLEEEFGTEISRRGRGEDPDRPGRRRLHRRALLLGAARPPARRCDPADALVGAPRASRPRPSTCSSRRSSTAAGSTSIRDAGARPQRAPRVPRRRRRQPRHLRGALPPPSRRRRGRALGPPRRDRERPPGLARLAAPDRPRRRTSCLGEGEAQRGGRRRPSLLASALRGARRRRSTSTSAGTPPGTGSSRWPAPELAADAPVGARSRAPRAGSRSTPSGGPASGPAYRLVEATGPDHEKLVPDRGPGRRRASLGRGRGSVAPDRRDRRRGAGGPAASGRRPRRAGRGSGGRAATAADRSARPRRGAAAVTRARPAPGPPAPGLQVVRRADDRRVRCRDQRGRRAERLGQEQPRRRPALGARRAGPGAPQPQGRGRHLGRLGEAGRPRAWPTSPSSSTTPTGCCRSSTACSSSAGGSTARARTTTCSTSSGSGCATSSTCSTRAHLADNAFLFIGQGMVDQALALRPEERRPLFEEVAGVRRHERRRRKAEEQLAESEANLARVEDILAELRPQARRLAAQAEQQATRATAGEELAAALARRGPRPLARGGRAARRGRRAARRGAGGGRTARWRRWPTAEGAAAAIAAELGARADARARAARGPRSAHVRR